MTAADRIDEALDAIAQRAGLGAFWVVDGERARAAAPRADGHGRPARPLAGTPVAVKDCFDVAGLPTTAGVAGAGRVATRDAELVRRLRAAGAIPVGKTAMDQLGWGTTGRAPGRPACVNPREPSRSPGGSSAGSAVAVAAGLVPLAIGTDTAGSVRVPAAFCGVVGFKPARRALPRRGLDPAVPSLETPGLLAGSVAGCRRAYEALTGRRVPGRPRGRLAIGRLDDLFDGADDEVAGPAAGALAALGTGHRVAAARLGWSARGLGRLFAAELHRTWGARIAAEPERFTDEVRDGDERGAAISDAQLREVAGDLARAQRRLRARLGAFDVLASPTVPIAAPAAGEELVDACTRYTRPFNALGWPAISVPCGTDRRGVPVGLQLAAPPARLPSLLAAAAAVEAAVGAAP